MSAARRAPSNVAEALAGLRECTPLGLERAVSLAMDHLITNLADLRRIERNQRLKGLGTAAQQSAEYERALTGVIDLLLCLGREAESPQGGEGAEPPEDAPAPVRAAEPTVIVRGISRCEDCRHCTPPPDAAIWGPGAMLCEHPRHGGCAVPMRNGAGIPKFCPLLIVLGAEASLAARDHGYVCERCRAFRLSVGSAALGPCPHGAAGRPARVTETEP